MYSIHPLGTILEGMCKFYCTCEKLTLLQNENSVEQKGFQEVLNYTN